MTEFRTMFFGPTNVTYQMKHSSLAAAEQEVKRVAPMVDGNYPSIMVDLEGVKTKMLKLHWRQKGCIVEIAKRSAGYLATQT
jgi:hypothetical protein